MRANYNKLQKYFEEKLPEPKKLAELLTFYSYEVESVKKEGDNYVFDIDVLPNRAKDSSDEAGIAKELSAILNIPIKDKLLKSDLSDIKIKVSTIDIKSLLGSEIILKEIEDIFKRLGFGVKIQNEEFEVSVPIEREDLKIKADVIEEVARIYGYKNIKAIPLKKTEKQPNINKKFYYANKIKNFLVSEGFSEVYTYSFRDKGEIEIIKPFASDKNFLRESLRDGILKSIEQNVKNIPLFDYSDIKIFEIGNVFTKDGEHTSFAIGWSHKDEGILDKLSEFIAVKLEEKIENNIFEINFDEFLKKFPEPEDTYIDILQNNFKAEEKILFKPISQYPFVLRDIAIWVPRDKTSNDVLKIIKKEAENFIQTITTDIFLANIKLFDEFKKDNRVSYAFNLVFQSYKKTLSDEDINKIIDRITFALNNNFGWEVR